ncbi:MAG TPA: DegQ family serine endoprotease [Candidatus Sulfotelmatobacter sp.]|nr:DegQ family serine endoprotease [Candidatus Sulfotelmatobacter sp.]
MSSITRKVPYFMLVLVLAILLVGGFFRAGVVHLPGHAVLGAEKVAVKVVKNPPPVSLADFKNGFSTVLTPALPAVVSISSTKVVKQPSGNVPNFFNDPMFRQFFGNQLPPGFQQGPQSEREYGLGSGVIVNADGYILTNNHVVSGASDVEVVTPDERQFKAKVIGSDPLTDVAVIKIEATGLPTLPLGDSSELKVGDVVFAIGQPFGVGETATMGIVSATGRGLGSAIEHYEDFIQTDAAINPGNSGGALIDLHGNLIGINTAILSGGGEEGGNEGVGFAIPINMARNVMDQIVEHGKVIRGYLGVTIQSVGPDMAKAFGLNHGGGALIGDVVPNSPASKAGLKRGDIVLELDGQAVASSQELSVRIAQMAPGTVAHLKVFRSGQNQSVDVPLGEFPEKGAASNNAQPSGNGPSGLKGISVENLTPEIARQLQLPASTSGVVVSEVDPSSAAAESGLQRGDVIQEVNRKPVHNMDEYRAALSGTDNQAVLLLVNHAGATHYVMVSPQ